MSQLRWQRGLRVRVGNVHPLWLYAILVLSLRRSFLQHRAGIVLVHGPDRTRLPQTRGVRRYVKFAAFHSAAVLAILYFELAVTGASIMALTVALLLWPSILAAVLALPRFRQFKKAIPMSEDQGFEGAAIYMTVFGLWGAISTALAVLMTRLKIDGGQWPAYSWLFVVPALATVLIRSLMQAHGGLSELCGIGAGNPSSPDGGRPFWGARRGIDRPVSIYAEFASHMFLIFGLAITILTLQNLIGIAISLSLCGSAFLWPTAIRRFIVERQYTHFLAQYQAGGARTPDAGLTWLGWLLMGTAAASTSLLILELTLGTNTPSDLDSGHCVSQFLATLHVLRPHSIWHIPIIAVELWAGFELVRMSAYAKVVAGLYGIAAILIAIGFWGLTTDIPNPSTSVFSVVLRLASLAFALVLPAATLVLVNRKTVFTTNSQPTTQIFRG